MSGVAIDSFFIEVIANAILKSNLQERLPNKNPRGLLLGMQFGESDWAASLEVSRRVNDKYWHGLMSNFSR